MIPYWKSETNGCSQNYTKQMSSIDQTIQKFESLRTRINHANYGDYQRNRDIFNELKTLLIEQGYDREIITIDHNDKFYTPPKDYERVYDIPDEKFKDHQGRLASLCTKAIRDLKQMLAARGVPKDNPILNTQIEKEIVYPPTSWKLLRDGLFWTILIGGLSIICLAFYNLGQNSKEKENAELVNENSERKAEIKELTMQLNEISDKLKACKNERTQIKDQLKN